MAAPDSIYFNGKILTVDSAFSISQAVAIEGDRFLEVGTNRDILSSGRAKTEKIDLQGHTVVPGLIEAHAHPEMASLSELEESLPNPHNLKDLLTWIKEQAESKAAGEWIIHPKMFSTRLLELRAPALEQLDSAAPDNPVFLNGTFGGVINSSAMCASNISEKTEHPGILKDKRTGKLNGKLHFTAFSLLNQPHEKTFSISKRAQALKKMFDLYNRVGFTGVTSALSSRKEIELYRYMKEKQMLTLRVFINIAVDFPFKETPLETIRESVKALTFSTGYGDEWIRIGALKVLMDGGILTGTALLRKPWGNKANKIFGVTDPHYRGIAQFSAGELAGLCRAGAEAGWKMTAHCTGGGAVDILLDAYEKVNRTIDVLPLRFSVIHGNFFTTESLSRFKELGIIADCQPAWFYKDGDAMLHILGRERMRDFHPYRSLIDYGIKVSAGSDHMVKLDSKDSINPYNPWLSMYTMVTRKTERNTVIVPEEAISREEALRCYTINNAYSSFEENIKGSIEPGKLADMVILEDDFLNCAEERIKNIEVKTTIAGGKVVYER